MFLISFYVFFPQRNVTNLCNLRLQVGSTFCDTTGKKRTTRDPPDPPVSRLPSPDCCRLSHCNRAVKGLSQAEAEKMEKQLRAARVCF